jgi:hypothetical protein
MDNESLWRGSAACPGADPELFFPLTEPGRSRVQIRQTRRRAIVADPNGRRALAGRASRAQSGTGGQWP